MGDAGLYYYYHTFAKALDAAGQDRFADADGKKHDWRSDLIDDARQPPAAPTARGSTRNARWLEGDANLVHRLRPVGPQLLQAAVIPLGADSRCAPPFDFTELTLKVAHSPGR